MKRSLSFLIFGLLGAVFTAAAVEAQSPQRARALYVSDSTSDNVWRVQDNNCDGDYNDPGEVVEFYNDVIGSVPLSNNVGIAVDPQGRILLCDTTADVIVRLTDMDGDGNANGLGEAKVVFDGNPAANPAGIRLFAANDLEVDAGGVVWIAVADGGGGGIDAIVRLEDLNMNDDFQDLGEALVYYQPANGGGVGDSLPADIKIGQDGKAYYLEVGSTGFWQKGIYRLDDIDGSGVIDNPATEVQPYFLPPLPAGATNQFFWGFQQDAQGAWYVADTLNELVYRLFDANGNSTIDAGESVIWWQNPGSSNPWMIDIGPDGSVYVAEDQTPDRLLRLVDLDFSGTIDQPNEVIEMYSDLVSATDLTRPRSLAIGPGRPVYRGNGADVAMSVAINGVNIDDGSQVHCMNPGDVVTFSMFSPNNTLTNQGFVLLAQVFNTGAAAAPLFLATDDPLPSVYLDLANPIFVLLDGLNPQLFAPILGNWQYTASIPPSLFGTGQSIMLELIARAPGFNNVGLGNASSHELLLP